MGMRRVRLTFEGAYHHAMNRGIIRPNPAQDPFFGFAPGKL
jgi:hypothetical protein